LGKPENPGVAIESWRDRRVLEGPKEVGGYGNAESRAMCPGEGG